VRGVGANFAVERAAGSHSLAAGRSVRTFGEQRKGLTMRSPRHEIGR
jgi:hypothetical protein